MLRADPGSIDQKLMVKFSKRTDDKKPFQPVAKRFRAEEGIP